ncbi:EIF3G [Enterospora canceri]|uniref:eIF3G n=1 Tax=Enterospora canceri TaxID=1081671 RepID=A0A1Y1S7C6_9MICR|nr:EIF3G [Enterospora canceri]
MLTKKFTPSEENVKLRSQISEFGTAAAEYNKNRGAIQDSPIPFVSYKTEKEEEVVTSTEKFMPDLQITNEYKRFSNDYSIRVSNIPPSVKQAELERLFAGKIERYARVYLVTDKVTNQSKGVAYVSVKNEEAGKTIVREIGEVVMDGFLLNLAVVKRY